MKKKLLLAASITLLMAALCGLYIPMADSASRVVLTPDNCVVLRGEVNAHSVQSVQLKLAYLVEKRGLYLYPIYLVLDSPGGSLDSGISLIQFAKTLKNVHTISIFAASVASATVQALPGNRFLTENGALMFHRASGTISGQFEAGEVESRLSYFKNMVIYMETQISNRMKIPLSQYKALIKDELWVTVLNYKKYNVADGVVDIVCLPDLIIKKDVIIIEKGRSYVPLTFSRCPLFRYPLPENGAKSFMYEVPSAEILNTK